MISPKCSVAYLSPVSFEQTPDGTLWLPKKTLSGIDTFIEQQDIPICVCAEVVPTAKPVSGSAPIEQYPRVTTLATPKDGLRPALDDAAQSFDLLTALHRPAFRWVEQLGCLVGYGAENSLPLRLDQAKAIAPTTMSFARMAVGTIRQEAIYREMARRADLIECNGVAAYRAYGHLNERALLFNDSRISTADLDAARRNSSRGSAQSLHVAYSGQWSRIKGIEYVLEVAQLCADERLPIRFSILGGGGDREPLVRQARLPNVKVVGHLDYDKEWKHYVRENVHVMLMPHVQGDPSGTYFEALGCGVPPIGFANQTLNDLAESGVAYAVPRAHTTALTSILRQFLSDRSTLQLLRQKGIDYMTERTIEKVHERRAALYRSVIQAR